MFDSTVKYKVAGAILFRRVRSVDSCYYDGLNSRWALLSSTGKVTYIPEHGTVLEIGKDVALLPVTKGPKEFH